MRLLREFISITRYTHKLQVCVNQNKQHNNVWKSPINLKLVFSLPHVVNTKVLIAINHSIFKKILKNLNGLESKFCKLYFLIS